ncbi:sigma-54-dependent Fis family transcriptional regulator [Halalkalibacillus sediminis]|uniref:Sigma-54-dependent Fis family transcriptional regulator n=1 Tax=Halalkalibacillus sediminis TaxID=2018042 RepID=A0A2I0QXV7_9BACI|nr:sigma 54-interacting transcriptional regulator [Halalkalibacillus sediminis]PKR78940.1 sigma-54-dependent Fis family transcriptional regulator [Halalkalibacillus sediminis]
MQNVLIVGAGKGGSAILNLFKQVDMLHVQGVADIDESAPGIQLAQNQNIDTYTSYREALNEFYDIIVETTGDENVFRDLLQIKSSRTVLIPGTVAHVMFQLLDEKEKLLNQIQTERNTRELILHSIHDGMIVIDNDHKVTFINEAAANIIQTTEEKALHTDVEDLIPDSKLPQTLKTKVKEINQELSLTNGKKIITTRIPLIADSGDLIGAFAVFKDITEVEALAEEITDLKNVQTMLQAIIQSSEEAISVVDERGVGMMINPAYTKITGLSEKDVIGQPATADISEGESMHMKVLKTRRAVRGARMKVGPNNRDVLVNVAPVIVDGRLKGSVGVIHDLSEIETLSTELKKARQIIRNLEAKYTFDDIVAVSQDMKLALEQAKVGARTPANVLLRGESGTGKELIAHAIHNESERKHNKFIRVNCATIEESNLEKMLLGDEHGAPDQRKGYFEQANQGSIFLDEIGDLSPHMQAKILRILENGHVVRMGGSDPVEVNVRIIAATNVNLERAIMTGEFREDLFYRLNRLPIHIPPLRERMDDLEPLVNHLIIQLNDSYGRNVRRISPEALNRLKQYNYPGNVRELENILARSLISMSGQENIISENHLPMLRKNSLYDLELMNDSEENEVIPLQEAMEDFEKQMILEMLEKNNFIKSKTAKQLNISIRNLYYKMEKYNLGKDREEHDK